MDSRRGLTLRTAVLLTTPPLLWAGNAVVGRLLDELRNPPHRHWACPDCREIIDGPFEQCWNCGATMPGP